MLPLCESIFTITSSLILCLVPFLCKYITHRYISKTAHGSSLLLPHSFRQASCCRNVKNIPTTAKFRDISVLLLLCRDISLNPGPVSFRVINCRLVRNKGLPIVDIVSSQSLDLLVITKTQIQPTGNLICLITPPWSRGPRWQSGNTFSSHL